MYHERTGLPLVHFADVSATTRIDFPVIRLDADLPEPGESPFPKPPRGTGHPPHEPQDDFTGCLLNALAERDLLGETTTLFNTADCSAPLMFVHFENRDVLAGAVAGPPALTAWMTAYRERFGGDMTLTLRGDGSGRSASRMIDDVLGAPGAALRASAPPSYFTEERARERDAFVSEWTQHCRPEEYDAALLDAALAASGLLPGTPPPPAALDSFEQAVGKPLPAAFRHLYAHTDGQPDFVNGFDLMSLAACRAQQEILAAAFDQLSLEDLRSDKTASGGTLPLSAGPGWLPIIDLFGGNYVVMDLTSSVRYGQIAVIGADIPRNHVVGRDLAHFLGHVTKFKERGVRAGLGPELTAQWR